MNDPVQIANQFAEISNKIRNALIVRFTNLYEANINSPELLIEIMLNENTAKLILEDFGFGDVYDSVINQYDDIALSVMNQIKRNAAPYLVESLKSIDTWTFYESVRDVGIELKKAMVRGALGGMSESAIRKQLEEATKQLADYQVGALVNTNLSTLSRTVFANAMEDMPENTLYYYDGPNDDKTREICREMLAAGPLTRAEIESRWPGAFTEGGGWNCRHEWRQYFGK